MPSSWNSEIFRERAKQWREQANAMPPGKEREACVVLAEGYASIAAFIEKSGLAGTRKTENWRVNGSAGVGI